MSVYHQMGHDSKNLVIVPELGGYKGAIQSPVNCSEAEMTSIIYQQRGIPDFEILFDPQLYYPHTEREILRSWSYFPNDFDTADYSSSAWWNNLCASIINTMERVRPTTICSPVIVPRAYTIEYFGKMLEVTDALSHLAVGKSIEVVHTLLVNLPDLASYGYVMKLASVLTKSFVDRIYLVIQIDGNPRREASDPEALKGAMLLTSLLEANHIRVMVSHASSDLLLWKEAGVSAVATGKYFNLRRFTPSRWDEAEEGGGGQIAYWIEESLMAFLRTSDITRAQGHGLLSSVSLANPFAQAILDSLANGTPWLATSWKFYLYWFKEVEDRVNRRIVTPTAILEAADKNWGIVEDKKFYMEERKNNGNWIREWLRATAEFRRPW